MDWLGKLLDTVAGGLPSAAAALCPEHLKKQWLERLADHNPFKTISANRDLVRATRLSWIEAAQEVLKEAQARAAGHEWLDVKRDILAFDDTIGEILRGVRDKALDRRRHPGASPIDVHVQAVIAGVPDLVSPGDHVGIGAGVSAAFTSTLAALTGWQEREIPAIYQQLAWAGLPTQGGGPNRPFGELVFAAFAELIKDPEKYPQAREAFSIAMGKLGRDLSQATLLAVQGLDGRLDAMLQRIDALAVLREGARRHLELLPALATDLAAANTKLDALLQRADAPIARVVGSMFRTRDGAARKDAAVSGFHYTLALDPFVGRAGVIRTIEAELLGEGPDGAPRPRFRWMALCGDGGTGKSRLAQELVHRNRAAWVHAGFVESDFLRQTAQVAEIGAHLDGPLFMVVDYAVAERAEVDLPRFMLAWADQAHRPEAHPVRIMLITRSKDELLLNELRGRGISPNRDLSRLEEIPSSPVVLSNLETSAAVELMRTRIRLTAERTGTEPVDIGEDALIAALDRFDERRRPLFAAMVASEIQRGSLPDRDSSQESNRLSLFGQYLQRQENDHWLPYARHLQEAHPPNAVRRHANLVRLATCCGDVGVQLVGSLVSEDVRKGLGNFPELSVADRAGAIRASLVGAMTGQPPKDDAQVSCADFMPAPKIIPRLEPDLIGERFLLMNAEEAGGGDNWARAEALAALSWACAPEATAAFLRMAAQDYPERMHSMQWLPPRTRDASPQVLKARAKMLRNVCSDIATRYGRTTISARDLERLFDIVEQFDEGLLALAESDAECREHYGQVLRQVANIGGRLGNAATLFIDPINAVEDGVGAQAPRSAMAKAFAKGGIADGAVAGRLDAEDTVRPLPPALADVVVARLPGLLDRAGRFLLRPGPFRERQHFVEAFRDTIGTVHFRHRDSLELGGRWPTPRDDASKAVLQDWRERADCLNRGDIDDVTVLAGLVSAFVYTDYENNVEVYAGIYPAIRRALGPLDSIQAASAGRICSMLGNALILKKEANELSAEERAHIAGTIDILLQLMALVNLGEGSSPALVRSVLSNFFTTGASALIQGSQIDCARLAEVVVALERLLAMAPVDTPLPADFLMVLAALPADLPTGVAQSLQDAVQVRFIAGAVDVDDFMSPNRQNLVYCVGQLAFGVPEPRLRLPEALARSLLQALASKVGARAIRVALEAVVWTLEQPAEVRAQVPLDIARAYVDELRLEQGFDARDYVSAAELALWGHDVLDGRIDRVQREITALWGATQEPVASRGRVLALWGVALVLDATRSPDEFAGRWLAWLKDAEVLQADADRPRLLQIGFGERDAEEFMRSYNTALVDACMAAGRLHIINGGDAADWIKETSS